MIKRELARKQDALLEEWLVVGLPKLDWTAEGTEVEIGSFRQSGLYVRIEIDRGIGIDGYCRVRISYDGIGTGRLATVNREAEYSLMIRRDARMMAREVISIARDKIKDLCE